MKVFYILLSLAVFTSGSPQYNAILFPGDVNIDIDDNETDDSYEYEDFGEYEDDPYAELEPFDYEGDYVELPEWMDTDLNELSLEKLAILNNVTEFTELSGFFELDLDAFLQLPNRTQPELGIDSRSGDPSPKLESEQVEIGAPIAIATIAHTMTTGAAIDPQLDVAGRSIIHPQVFLRNPEKRRKKKRRRKKKKAEKEDENAQFAKCKPEKVTVELPKATKNTLYMPSCVRLMRCGGCCNSKLLSCQPSKVENITLTVMKISKKNKRSSRRGRRRRTSGQKVPMPMQNHVKCKCDCKVQEEDCDPEVHNYNKGGCRCECKNGDEEMECQKSSALHEWDKKLCSCMCRKEKECSTGELFSQDTCKCVAANGGDV